VLHNVAFGKVAIRRTPYTPALLLPLVKAAEEGDALEPALNAIVKLLGFETFMFAMSVNPRGHHESQSYVYTTLPAEWVVRYDQMAYIEIDPRVLKTWNNALPMVWDYDSERGKDAKTDVFLDDAARHGVASGVAFALHDPRYERVLVALNSSDARLDNARRAFITSKLGEMLLLGTFFHELFMKGIIDRGLAPISRGAALSHRQRECLQMACHGLSTEDIAYKLGITVRTTQFHFDSIRSKLAAANRQEAVAKGIAEGLISRR
jgi:DNA-binding CsgD family transcriptional regulator